MDSGSDVRGVSAEPQVWLHLIPPQQIDVTPATARTNPWLNVTQELMQENFDPVSAALGEDRDVDIADASSDGDSSSDEEERQVQETLLDEGVTFIPEVMFKTQVSNPRAIATLHDDKVNSYTSAPPLNFGAQAARTDVESNDDTLLSNLMRSISIAVQNGVREGVKQAVHAREHTPAAASELRHRTDRRSKMQLDNEEYDGDEEEQDNADMRSVSRRGPRGKHTNLLHARFRQYLRDKGILPAVYNALPPSAPSSTIQAFMDGSGDGPDLSEPLMDWRNELSSQWNKEMILLLSREFVRRVKSGSELPLVFDPELMSETQMMRFCTTKLRRVHSKFRDIDSVDSGKRKADEAAASRRNTRRHGTFMRRAQIINANMNSNSQLWGTIEETLDLLEVAGMSSDHTDEEAGRQFKIVRRARVPWRSDKLCELFTNLDTYHASTGSLKGGNRAIPRTSQLLPSSPKRTRRCVQRLPKSFYDPQWLASLSKIERHTLGYTSDVEIPQIHPYRSSTVGTRT